MEWISDPEVWAALATLTALEIVLGIDNIVFISILSGRLPEEQRRTARRLGLFLAMFTRIALLFSITWVMGLTEPLFSILGEALSGRDLILIVGGLFLIYKATREIHDKLEQAEEGEAPAAAASSFAGVLVQIALLDVVFSLDSVITAVGMAEELWIMVVAVVVAVAVMMISAEPLSAFVEEHPTVKVLALSFLLMIGLTLIAEGLDHHVPKGYVYSAIAFSVFVESVNLRLAKKRRAEAS